MIRLHKGDEPEVLARRAREWTKVLLDKQRDGITPSPTERTRYRHPEVKQAVIAETHGKCAYCESYLLHIHHGDIEHIYPKSLDVAKAFQWTNLTLACEICNQSKSDNDPDANAIIDPYVVDPALHIFFCGSLIVSCSPLGKSSITILRLDRAALSEARLEKFDRLTKIVEQLFRADLPVPARKAILDDLRTTELAASKEYAAMARCFFAEVERRLPPELQ